LQLADSWLQDNIAPLISNATFQKDGLLIIVFDEAATSDTEHGGGHVAAVLVSPKAKQGFQSTTLYQHQSLLRLILEGLGVSNLPGASSTAPTMGEFF
jgi:acid phosphatase